jgi:hypothetical protein
MKGIGFANAFFSALLPYLAKVVRSTSSCIIIPA